MFINLRRISILNLFFIFISAHSAQANSYVVSIKEPRGEITGYKCQGDEVCRIKILTLSEQIITTKIQFTDKKALLLFKWQGDYLYASTSHYAERKSLVINLEDKKCVKQTVYLLKDYSSLDDGILCHGTCGIADLKIKICPAHM
jgi:hypothetical protein